MEFRTNPPASSPDLDDLLSRARGGDTRAEQLLFERLRARIGALAKKRIWDPQAQEDLVQETLKTVFEKYRGLEPSREFLPWVFTVFHHKVGNYLKRRRAQADREFLAGQESVLDRANAPVAEEIEVIDLWESLEKALTRTSADCRRIFELLLSGADRKEIQAAFPGEPPGTTDSRVSRCRKRLLDELDSLWERKEP